MTAAMTAALVVPATPATSATPALVLPEPPIPAGHIRLRNRVIVRIHAALVALSQRRLSGPDNEKRVVVLLRRYFNTPREIIDDRKKLNIRNNPVPPDWEGEGLPIAVQEARADLYEQLMDEWQDLPAIPDHLLLSDADMPKPMKGELGDQNQCSVAEIKTMLDLLYPLPSDSDDSEED